MSGNYACSVTTVNRLACATIGGSWTAKGTARLPTQVTISGTRLCGVLNATQIACTDDITPSSPTWTDIPASFTMVDMEGDNVCGLNTATSQVHCAKYGTWTWQEVVVAGAKDISITAGTLYVATTSGLEVRQIDPV